jgi:hypothetical protein
MKTLVVYYSLTEKTHVVAQALAAALGADVRRVEDVEKPSVSWWFIVTGGLAAMRGVESEIRPIDTSFQGDMTGSSSARPYGEGVLRRRSIPSSPRPTSPERK